VTQSPPQAVFTYRNQTWKVILIVLGVLIPCCEGGLPIILPLQKAWLPVVLSTLILAGQYGYILLRYLNAQIAIKADAVEAVGPLKKSTRIRFEDILAVDLLQPGKDGPLAVVRSRDAKIAVQKGINDWPRLKEALESMKLSGST
jgi:hypothetical protein